MLTARYGGQIVLIPVKVSPDLLSEDIVSIAEVAMDYQIEGFIATKTIITRDAPINHRHYAEPGGLSGKLPKDQSTSIVRKLAESSRPGNQIADPFVHFKTFEEFSEQDQAGA